MKASRIADYYSRSILGLIIFSLFILSLLFTVLQIRESEEEVYVATAAVEEARKNEVKGHVLRSLNLISYMKETYPTWPSEYLQSWVLRRLRAISFGSAGYVFVLSHDGRLLLTGAGKETMGTNLFDSSDPATRFVAAEAVKAVEASPEGDFIEYFWEKPGGDKKEKKLSFVAPYPVWSWIIGAGVYVEDLYLLQEKEISRIRLRTLWNLVMLFLFFGLVIAAAILVSRRYAGRISGDTDRLARFMAQAGKNTPEISELDFRFTEFKSLAGVLHRTSVELVESRKEIEKTLHEKEVLLKEIHHRVKNNLQIIVSLLSMGGRQKGNEAPQLFQESEQRIHSMALLHELLYESKDFNSIKMDEYITRILSHLKHGYETAARGIVFETELDSLVFDIDTALPCGLLVNEMVSNAFKYAFDCESAAAKKIVKVVFRREEASVLLEVEDNGRGIPGGRDPKDFSSVGVMLIGALSSQLKGTCALEAERGTRWTVRFPG